MGCVCVCARRDRGPVNTNVHVHRCPFVQRATAVEKVEDRENLNWETNTPNKSPGV